MITHNVGTLFAQESRARAEGQSVANTNETPVAIIVRQGWYAVCEDAEVVEAIEAGAARGWRLVGLIEPEEKQ